MQSAIEYAAIPTINLTPLFLVTNPLTNSSQSDNTPLTSHFLVKQTDCCYILGSHKTIVKTVFEEKTFFAKKGNENGTRTPYFFSRTSACCSF